MLMNGKSCLIPLMYHFRRVKKLLESSKNIALGGDSNEQDRYIAPSVLTDISFKDGVMQEEVKFLITYEPRNEKTCFLHMQKQKCRSASQ